MIDLHGHYLPAVDDGAENGDESLAMLLHARADGIETVVVTPHACGSLSLVKEFDTMRARWSSWREDLKKRNLGISVVSGAEVYFTSELLSLLKDNHDVLTINNGSYFLLEFPSEFVYAHSKDFIYNILTEGFIPIISHAERNSEIQRNISLLNELVEVGALCQINAGSLRGDFGNAARQSAYDILQRNLVHVIASDAHNLVGRKPELSYVPSLLRNVEPEKIAMYLHDIPAAIIADQAIPDIGEPRSPHSKASFFDLFKRKDS